MARHHLARMFLGLMLGLLVTGALPARAGTLGDIVYPRQRPAGEIAIAYFPHWVHRIQYKCYACHDDLFAMKRGEAPTMAAMAKGQSCGACHNGKAAFGTDMCQRCHIGP